MPKFLVHETLTCEVTFVRRLEADDHTDAVNMAYDSAGELIGVSIGDSVAGMETINVLPDVPHNIPSHFYKEPEQ